MNLTKLLSGCKSWEDINNRLNTLPIGKRRLVFPDLVRVKMLISPEYQSQLRSISRVENSTPKIKKLVGAMPPTTLLAETFDNEIWAIHCHYSGRKTLPWKGIDGFLSPAPPSIAFHLLATNADHPEKGLPKKVGFQGLDTWEQLTAHDIQNMQRVAKGEPWRPQKYKPHKIQQTSLLKLVRFFKDLKKTRGKISHPCGVGKSLIGYWAHTRLQSKRTLVTVPSLQLVRQTLRVWCRENVAEGKSTAWACICSDKSVSRSDDTHITYQDLGVPCLTSRQEIKEWITANRKQGKPIVVFCTYQSAKLFAEACLTLKFGFDLAIHDEAHKTAGRSGKPFAHTIHNQNLKAKYRIFMTATERHYNGTEQEVLSMDDPKVYGETIHMTTFKEAAAAGIICDHRILAISVKKSEIRSLIESNHLVLPDNEEWLDGVPARNLAALIALHKAMDKYPITHALVFNNSIRRAEMFRGINEDYCKIIKRKMESFHVSGRTPAGQRAHTLREFEKSEKALITNARCLTEGVDVPNMDAVVFADPRRARVDLVQGIGRTLRTAPGKTHGYIILPVIIDDKDPYGSGAYDDVINILRMLAHSDDRIIEFFNRLNEKLTGEEELAPWPEDEVFVPIGFSDFKKSLRIKEIRFIENWASLEDAQKFAQTLEDKSRRGWRRISKARKLPTNMPAAPPHVYRGEWQGWDHFFGRIQKKFGTFENAMKFARTLPEKTTTAWKLLSTQKKLPNDIPSDPSVVYSEWNGWNHFFGTERKRTTYKQASAFAKTQKISTAKEWGELVEKKKIPSHIPKSPRAFFKSEWQGWEHFLGLPAKKQQKPKRRQKHQKPQKQATLKQATLKEAQACAKKLEIKTGDEWTARSNAGKLPAGMPHDPPRHYKDQWQGWATFFGRHQKEATFEEARAFARTMTRKSGAEWTKLHKEKKLPASMPASPQHTYKGQWEGWDHFFGRPKKQMASFKEAQTFAKTSKIKTGREWRNLAEAKKLPFNIPKSPSQVYKDQWCGWDHFLGHSQRPTFKEAMEFGKTLTPKTSNEWRRLGKAKLLPVGMPKIPNSFYKKEWKGWDHFFGRAKRDWGTFEEAQAFASTLPKKTGDYWKILSSSGKLPSNMPATPNEVYKTQWKGWPHFFNTEVWAPFEEAKAFAQSMEKKKSLEWARLHKMGKLPKNLPVTPNKIYKEWRGWADFFGKETISKAEFDRSKDRKNAPWATFDEARAFAKTVKRKSSAGWKELSKKNLLPPGMPSNPNLFYKEQWVDWHHFFDKPKNP